METPARKTRINPNARSPFLIVGRACRQSRPSLPGAALQVTPGGRDERQVAAKLAYRRVLCAGAGEEIVDGLGLAQTRYVAFTASTEWRGFAEV